MFAFWRSSSTYISQALKHIAHHASGLRVGLLGAVPGASAGSRSVVTFRIPKGSFAMVLDLTEGGRANPGLGAPILMSKNVASEHRLTSLTYQNSPLSLVLPGVWPGIISGSWGYDSGTNLSKLYVRILYCRVRSLSSERL